MSDFHGVYLLCSISHNKGVKGTYIGYTVCPGRRILQHNRFKKGGAHKTAKLAPWDMILCVYNFPSRTAGLRFEWAWQNPKVSVRLKMFDWQKKKRETGVQYQVRVLEKMLNVTPWNKLPVTVQWLRNEYKIPLTPPLHIPIAHGPIEENTESSDTLTNFNSSCLICMKTVTKDLGIYCVSPTHCTYHLTCLSQAWTNHAQILPLSGLCKNCDTTQLWGEMVRLKKSSLSESKPSTQSDHWTDQLTQAY